MSISIWSLDDGYGDIKGSNGKFRILIPSFSTRWRSPSKKELVEGQEHKIDPFDHLGVEINGEMYLVGKGAIEQDARITWSGSENKHTDSNFPILLKTALGVLAYDTKSVVVEPLVMGLPVKADENQERHKLLEQIVCQNHKMKLYYADGKITENEVFIKQVVTKKQPFGSLMDVILDKGGEIKDKIIASQFNVVVDIGARTLNIYTIDALEPVNDLSDTTNDGIYTAYEWVSNYIEDKLGSPVPSGKIISIIQKKEIRGLDLVPIIQKSYETLANQIYRVVSTILVDSWVFVDRIIFTGGGSELLKQWLNKAFQGKNIMFLDRFATTRGLRKYGMRVAKQSGKNIIFSQHGGGSAG